VNIKDAAPTFDVLTDTGARFSLAGVRGRWVVIWFFPESESLSTNTQARGFERLLESFINLSAVVVGVSIEA
jgi:thioredoxin-dependent peroxiredoxin